MTRIGAQGKLQCPIGLFERQEAKIEELTKAINVARTAAEKAPKARVLCEAVSVVLECGSYDRTNPNCGLCRDFSELRLKTTSLIVQMGSAGGS